jgi:hypothetical protein
VTVLVRGKIRVREFGLVALEIQQLCGPVLIKLGNNTVLFVGIYRDDIVTLR